MSRPSFSPWKGVGSKRSRTHFRTIQLIFYLPLEWMEIFIWWFLFAPLILLWPVSRNKFLCLCSQSILNCVHSHWGKSRQQEQTAEKIKSSNPKWCLQSPHQNEWQGSVSLLYPFTHCVCLWVWARTGVFASQFFTLRTAHTYNIHKHTAFTFTLSADLNNFINPSSVDSLYHPLRFMSLARASPVRHPCQLERKPEVRALAGISDTSQATYRTE